MITLIKMLTISTTLVADETSLKGVFTLQVHPVSLPCLKSVLTVLTLLWKSNACIFKKLILEPHPLDNLIIL